MISNSNMDVEQGSLVSIIGRVVALELQKQLETFKESLTIDKENFKLLNRKEACSYLGVCSTTLWELTKEGVLPCKRIKSKVLYLKSDLDSFILNDCA